MDNSDDGLGEFRAKYPKYSHLTMDQLEREMLVDRDLADCCGEFIRELDARVEQSARQRKELAAKLRAEADRLDLASIRNSDRGILGDIK